MSTSKKVVIGLVVLLVLGGIVYANFAFKRTTGASVTTEKIDRRDLEAIVSASGTIQPKTSVDMSADTMGRVVNLAVNEGDSVKKGQFLLQIDPRNLETQVQNQEASLAASQSSLEELKKSIESSKVALQQAQSTLKRQEDLNARGLTTRMDYENATNDVRMREANLQQNEQSVKTQQQRIAQQQAMLESARYDLTKVRIVSPLDGIITRRNILEGETVVIGTMNNAGTNLLTIADMSVVQAEVEVDETDIPTVKIGLPGKIKVDAYADQEFPGRVTEVGNSPIQATGTSTTRATNFKVKVQLDKTIPGVRPGFTCTAVITTATRKKVVSVPIQAATVREMIIDEEGSIVRNDTNGRGRGTSASTTPGALAPLKPGQSRKEIDGVFLIKDGKAFFEPVKTGIAGEKYFEVLSGLKEGDEVITGPFASVRGMKDGDAVKITPVAGAGTTSAK
jgi:HlyD family secretion protein